MSEHDLPEGTVEDGARTFDEGVGDITDLLQDPETDLSEEDQESEQADAEDDEEEGDESDASEDEEDADLEDEDEELEEDDDSGEYAGGRFAADNAKVKLDDGTTITIADLKRNNLFQRDYTRKTTELAEQRKAFEATQQRVSSAAEELGKHRDFLLSVYSSVIPQPPDPSMMENDLVGYMMEKDAYDRRMAELNQLRQLDYQQKQRALQEDQETAQSRLIQEQQKLYEKMPEFRDEAKLVAFREDVGKFGVEDYGFTPDELGTIEDHRYVQVLRDAIAYRKLKQKAPEAKKKLESKPKMLKQRRRMDPKAKTSREAQVRSQRLQKTGDFDAGVAALMDLDL